MSVLRMHDIAVECPVFERTNFCRHYDYLSRQAGKPAPREALQPLGKTLVSDWEVSTAHEVLRIKDFPTPDKKVRVRFISTCEALLTSVLVSTEVQNRSIHLYGRAALHILLGCFFFLRNSYIIHFHVRKALH